VLAVNDLLHILLTLGGWVRGASLLGTSIYCTVLPSVRGLWHRLTSPFSPFSTFSPFGPFSPFSPFSSFATDKFRLFLRKQTDKRRTSVFYFPFETAAYI
jgi:hypothetical protein